MSKNYLLFGDQKEGPFSEEEIRAMISAGKASSQTLHWEEGMQDWEPLGTKVDSSSTPATIAPPRRSKDTSVTIDFKDTLRQRKNLSARAKPITPGKAIALFFLFFLVLTGMIELFGHFLPDVTKQFNEHVRQINSQK